MANPELSAWIGRTQFSEDVISRQQVSRAAATLDLPRVPAEGGPLPPLWHWMFFQEAVATARLVADGHAPRGDFLPPVALPSRMWAGSRIELHKPLLVGKEARRTSTVIDIKEKIGRSGPLAFVTVRHDYTAGNELAVREEQDIVYREPSGGGKAAAETPPPAEWSQVVHPSEVLLFRYSALTFNGHRIHYDHPYATGDERYPGLIVHGPLIATLMCQAFINAHPDVTLTRFAFRGLRPLFSPQPFQVAGKVNSPGAAQLWAADQSGTASRAEVEYV